MPFENTKILEFNQYQKSDKGLFIIYPDLEFILEKINACKNSTSKSKRTHSIRFFKSI